MSQPRFIFAKKLTSLLVTRVGTGVALFRALSQLGFRDLSSRFAQVLQKGAPRVSLTELFSGFIEA